MTHAIKIKDGLLTAATAAMKNAHAPYSQFYVGAAVVDADGDIHVGCNVENAAYPEGLCAEAAAIAAMVTAGKKKIQQICIVSQAGKQVPPCGGCRQKIYEFADQETVIFVCDPDGVQQQFLLAELLPHSFERVHFRELK